MGEVRRRRAELEATEAKALPKGSTGMETPEGETARTSPSGEISQK